MQRVKLALAAIRADGSKAAEVLEAGYAADGREFLEGLALFIVLAYSGIVLDPDQL